MNYNYLYMQKKLNTLLLCCSLNVLFLFHFSLKADEKYVKYF